MEKKLKRSFYAIPAIYLLLMSFFFFMHFSQRISFSRAIGNIELTGQATKGTPVKPSEIRRLNMYVNGMSFLFNSNALLKVTTADGIIHRSSLLDYSAEEDKFILNFENDINLSFATDFADSKIIINADIPETVPPIQELSLPFKEDRGFSLGYREEDNTPVISNGETRYFLALTNEFSVDSEKQNIIIDIPDNNPVTLVIQETLVDTGRTAENWYDQNTEELASDFSESVSTFINNAFFGWNSRFNSKTGKWTDGEGQEQFNEETVTSYLAESLIRGSYKTSANLIRTASVPLENELTAWTAPYLGNIVVKGKELLNTQNLERRDLISMLDKKDEAILQYPNLFDFMRSNNLENRVEDVLLMAMELDEDAVFQSISKLEIINANYYDFPQMDFDNFITEAVENHILPIVSWLDEGLFLKIENTISVKTSFKAGKELLRAGNLLNNDFYRAVGFKMITSVLIRAGESSFLPELITTENNRIVDEQGSLPPEEFYNDLTENSYIVRQQPLEDSLGKGAWILTSANNVTVQKTARETVLNINFPKGSTHSVAIKGVKPFVRLYMHGVNWRPDANFQRYSDGWFYDRFNEVLYLKLKHRVDTESIRILYYNPDIQSTATTQTSQTSSSTARTEGS